MALWRHSAEFYCCVIVARNNDSICNSTIMEISRERMSRMAEYGFAWCNTLTRGIRTYVCMICFENRFVLLNVRTLLLFATQKELHFIGRSLLFTIAAHAAHARTWALGLLFTIASSPSYLFYGFVGKSCEQNAIRAIDASIRAQTQCIDFILCCVRVACVALNIVDDDWWTMISKRIIH